MSIPSNTNPKLAKMENAERRKTTIVHRGAVFHALGRQSPSDFDRFMLFGKNDTTGPYLCAEFYQSAAAGLARIWTQERRRGVLPREIRITCNPDVTPNREFRPDWRQFRRNPMTGHLPGYEYLYESRERNHAGDPQSRNSFAYPFDRLEQIQQIFARGRFGKQRE
jgi:hypothetical protein